jgi:cytochrome c oxidase subunit 4
MAEHAIQAHGEHTDESHDIEIHEVGVHHVDSSKKRIWTVFFIMLGITVVEFIIALYPGIRRTQAHPDGALSKDLVVGIFLALTVLKAFYIVGYFMHLKMEKVTMVYTVLLPIMFIIYLIALLMIEGTGGTGSHTF